MNHRDIENKMSKGILNKNNAKWILISRRKTGATLALLMRAPALITWLSIDKPRSVSLKMMPTMMMMIPLLVDTAGREISQCCNIDRLLALWRFRTTHWTICVIWMRLDWIDVVAQGVKRIQCTSKQIEITMHMPGSNCSFGSIGMQYNTFAHVWFVMYANIELATIPKFANALSKMGPWLLSSPKQYIMLL